MKKKIITFIFALLIVSSSIFLLKKTYFSKKTPEQLINISELSEEFMQDYFEDIKEISKENNKDNIIIVTSARKIKDSYGATDVVEAPNHQYFLQYNTEEEKDQALEKLKADKNILTAEENAMHTVEETEYNSWGINKMVLDTAIDVANEKDLQEVVVAVLDTGCDMTLANKYYEGKIKETYNVFSKSTSDMTDTHGHGTHVLGTIAEGTPDNVKIIPIKISNDGGIYTSDVIAAVNYVTYYEKADVMNMSFGGYEYTSAEEQVINAANSKNIISVAAAGNDNSPATHYPSSFDNVISIASVDSSLNKSSFSNWGAKIMFTAPGSGIKSIMSSTAEISENMDGDDDHETISGTSMATPHAVSAVALLKSYNKNLTYENVVDLLKRTAIDLGSKGWDRNFGYGFISFATAEFCDGVDCDEFNVLKKDLEELTVKKIEAPNQIMPDINYGNITNLQNASINVYYTNTAYYTKQLWELDNLEITGYDPYSYTVQEVNINYEGKSTTLTVDNRGAGSSGWEYEIVNEKSIRLTELKVFSITPKRIYIPNEYDGYTVTEIGEQIFYNNTLIKYIILPETITKIDNHAFYGCGAIRVDSPDVEIEIGNFALANMEYLTSFSGIVKSMGGASFYNCPQLDNITLSDNIESIGASSFYNDINLKNINIPDSITIIGANAFNYTNIESIVIPSGISRIYHDTFSNCLNLTSVTLPEGLTAIEPSAFSYTNIRELHIPKSLTDISETAFSYIGSLQTITVDKENPVYDSRENCNAIIKTSNNRLFRASNNTTVPDNVYSIGDYAYTGAKKDDSDIFEIPNHITSIGNCVFSGSNYMPIKVPRSVVSIGVDAFGSKSSMVYIYSDSYAKTYVTDNSYNYRHIDPTRVWVTLPQKQYKAFETVDTTDMYVNLSYEEEKQRLAFYRPGEFNITYNEGNNFKYGDTYFTVSLYNEANEYIETQVAVTVEKAQPTYTPPEGLTAIKGQLLSEIILPSNFEWMNPTQVITEAGEQTFKARYIPNDTNNYEIVENIDITVNVTIVKSIITPNITISDKTYDGTNTLNTNNVTVSNLQVGDYTIESLTTNRVNVGKGTATITLRLTNDKFVDYEFEGGLQEKEFTVNYNIIPLKLTKPTSPDYSYVYTGNEITFDITNYDENTMIISGNKGTDAGNYDVIVSLKNSNYAWSDNSTGNIQLSVTISKAPLGVTDFSEDNTVEYDGVEHSVHIDLRYPVGTKVRYMDQNNEYTLTEVPKYIEVGTYTIKYKLHLDNNHQDHLGEKNLTITRAIRTVTFNANGGTGEMNSQEFDKNVSQAINKNTFTRVGYKFTGWNTKADGSGTSYNDKQSIAISENIILYAQWTECDIVLTSNKESIDFGETEINFSEQIKRKVTIKNEGNIKVKLSIDNPTGDGPFGSLSFENNKELDPGEEYEITLIGNPSSPFAGIKGTYNGNYVITATSIDNVNSSELTIPATIVLKLPPIKVSYKTHVQSYGWQPYVSNGAMAGTQGEAKRLEAIKIKLENQEYSGNILYRTHIQSYGWEKDFKKNDEMSGTSGEAKRLEAIEIKLDGEMANHYDVYYRVHAQSYGWLGWAKNGEQAGTAGYAKRLEGIEIKLVEKDQAFAGYGDKESFKDANAPTGVTLNKTNVSLEVGDELELIATIEPDYANDKTITWTSDNEANVTVDNGGIITAIHEGTATITATTANGKKATCQVNILPPIPGVEYITHVQSYGWQEYVRNGNMAGTQGEAKRLESIKIRLRNAPYTGNIEYRTHIQSYGWEEGFKKNDEMSGTSGEAKRLEAIEIKLTGEMADHYDIYYRVHAQSYGWLGWAKNGERSGTAGYAKRLEGIEIVLVEKGAQPPERSNQNDERAYIEK